VSYSGNTEETVSFANEAFARGLPLAVVSSGGMLATFAKIHELPYVHVPDGIAPRNALLYLVRALLGLLGEDKKLERLAEVDIDLDALEAIAEHDAHFFVSGVPLFYTSSRNTFLARLGTLIMQESARTPAFSNVFPELNHNEMQAFDKDMPEGLEHLFRMLMVRDDADDSRILKRMHLFEKMMRDRTRTVRTLDLTGFTREEALVKIWIRFLYIARFLAETRNINPDTEPFIEEFKSRL
jgi:glucose/mannose-6-phosphate isomerase